MNSSLESTNFFGKILEIDLAENKKILDFNW